MEHIISALWKIVDMALVDELVMGRVDSTLINAKDILICNIWLVWGLNQVLRGERFPVRVLRMRRQPGVEVGAEDMHDDSRVSGQVCVPLASFEVSTSVPSKRAHTASLRKFFDPFK